MPENLFADFRPVSKWIFCRLCVRCSLDPKKSQEIQSRFASSSSSFIRRCRFRISLVVFVMIHNRWILLSRFVVAFGALVFVFRFWLFVVALAYAPYQMDFFPNFRWIIVVWIPKSFAENPVSVVVFVLIPIQTFGVSCCSSSALK